MKDSNFEKELYEQEANEDKETIFVNPSSIL